MARKLTARFGLKLGKTLLQLNKGADIATATTITVPQDGNFHALTGGTTIDGIRTARHQKGSIVVLVAAGAGTITNNSGTPGTGAVKIITKAGANITTAADRAYMFMYTGTVWSEI